jgi:methyl-accepting chemotaxis protein
VLPVYEIAMDGVLIGGADAGRLASQAMIEGTLEGVGACRLRVVEQSKAGARAQFVNPDAALREKIEDRLWSIHEENTEFVTRAMEAGNALTGIFEQAVARGEVKIEDLFDTDYAEIAGTNPQQYRTRYLDWADRALPSFQEAFLAKDPRLAFCAMVDRNGFLPVHNKIYSHPQRPGDAAWNTANSRNRRMFNDPAGLAAARNLRSYLVQSYARDMGNGNTVMMREIDVPIRVQGRHWGGFRTAYKL